MYPAVTLQLPAWVAAEIGDSQRYFPTLEARMALAICLAERNVVEGAGGPFGAAVFEIESGLLVAPGVNIVAAARCSVAHAEAMAIMVAQQVCGAFDLSGKGLPPMELVTSAQPCIQCFGNVWWSGLQRLVIGARKEDVETLVGFDEGPLPENWPARLENRAPLPPVRVVRDVLREQACAPLRLYRERGGLVYNAGSL